MTILDDFTRFINSDRYQYTESDVLVGLGWQNRQAAFDYFFRKSEDGGFTVVAGVESVVRLIESLNNTPASEKRAVFSQIIREEELLEALVNLTFTGNIYAMREGELAYANQPIMVVEGDLLSTKILETPLLNAMNYQMAIASKASRVSRAAAPRQVLAFGPRRAHGFDGAALGAKAALIGGCAGHSALATEYLYNEPSVGTMSHSYIQAFGVGSKAEYAAFKAFIEVRKKRHNSLLLLIDTYDSLAIGLPNAIKAFQDNGISNDYIGGFGIRIDSGDLAYQSKRARAKLDEAGLTKAKIVLTNGLDEYSISNLILQGACFDSVGVGDAIAVSRDNPCFGGVYKLVSIDGQAVIKVSGDRAKTLTPARKELYRIYQNGEARADLITLQSDSDKEKLLAAADITITAEQDRLSKTYFEAGSYTVRPLLVPMVLNGRLTEEGKLLSDVGRSRSYYQQNLATFSAEHKRLSKPHLYKVNLSEELYNLKYNLIKEIILN
ncbi:MAG: nicotinate phosphoribosyltransferase [Spirochaetaceae bacterium]|nr:nicotinate phosphoribosyltransferase [Spirochaetaceae bacterium]